MKLENLTFALDGDLKAGVYEIVVRDITHGLDEADLLADQRIDLKLMDSEAEAEAAAAAAAAGGGKKKK